VFIESFPAAHANDLRRSRRHHCSPASNVLFKVEPSLHQLPSSLRQPHSSPSVSVHAPATSSYSLNLTLSPSITPSLFHCRLKTYLFTQIFPTIDSLPASGLTPRLYDWSVSSDHLGFLWSPYVIGRPYIFLPCSFFLLFFSSPNLSGRISDVYHTSTHGVALVRI